MNPRFLVAPAALVLAACASAPVHDYTLLPAAAAAATSAAPPGQAQPFELMPVRVPAEVDRQALVLREGNGRLRVEDNHQWAAPLSSMLGEALSADLSRRLGAVDVSGLATDPQQPRERIVVDVSRFDSIYGQSARVVAHWSVRTVPGTQAPLTCTADISESVTTGYDALVAGQQRAVAALAARIAASLSSSGASGARCP